MVVGIVALIFLAVMAAVPPMGSPTGITVEDIGAIAAAQARLDTIAGRTGRESLALFGKGDRSGADLHCLSDLGFEAELADERLIAVHQMAFLLGPQQDVFRSVMFHRYISDELAKWATASVEVKDLSAMCAANPFALQDATDLLAALNEGKASMIQIDAKLAGDKQ
jgi:hypothetical protein